jgi:hypothetical protein
MKFGKRSDGDDAGAAGASVGDPFASAAVPPLPPVPDSPPPVAEHEVPAATNPSVTEQETAGYPGGEELPVAHVEPVVEGEAYEVFADEPPEALTVHQHEPQHQPAPMPFPIAEQPISVVTPGPGPAPVTTLGDSAEAFASGHAAAPGPSWQEPVMQIANERPELVVVAAFAGGLLTAMILRRLGH